jgi:arginine N-succinyltransferase
LADYRASQAKLSLKDGQDSVVISQKIATIMKLNEGDKLRVLAM